MIGFNHNRKWLSVCLLNSSSVLFSWWWVMCWGEQSVTGKVPLVLTCIPAGSLRWHRDAGQNSVCVGQRVSTPPSPTSACLLAACHLNVLLPLCSSFPGANWTAMPRNGGKAWRVSLEGWWEGGDSAIPNASFSGWWPTFSMTSPCSWRFWRPASQHASLSSSALLEF